MKLARMARPGLARSGLAAVAPAIALVTLALPSASSAAPLAPGQVLPKRATSPRSALAHRRARPGVTLGVSSLYHVTVPPGTWLPVNLSVSNHESAAVRGEIVVEAPAAQAGLATSGCLSNGPSTFTCIGSGGYSSTGQPGTGQSGAGQAARGPSRDSSQRGKDAVVDYRAPLELAANTSKQLSVYVMGGPPGQAVSALFESGAGRVLARARAQLPVAYSLAPPAVLVVTDSPSAVPVMSEVVAPTGARPELQYLTPSELPSGAAALGAFKAIAIDQANTAALSPAQGQALEGYVDAGGDLVVAGGLDWRETMAGLPPGLLPGHPTGSVTSLALPGLSSLLGRRYPFGKVDVDLLDPAHGATETMAQGNAPLVLEETRGSGHVVLCAFDPAAAPLATWPGARALLARLFASAYQPGYYDSSLPYGEAGGVFPVAPLTGSPSAAANLGGNFDTGSALMSPANATNVLTPYLQQVPAVSRPPGTHHLDLLLFGYIGLVCLVLVVVGVAARRRRSTLVWAVVPLMAASAVVAASLARVAAETPLVEEVRVSQLPPGHDLAQVVSLGVLQLPDGGSRRAQLSNAASPGLVGNLPAGPGAAAVSVGQGAVGQGAGSQASSVTVRGEAGTRGGWTADETVNLSGSVGADLKEDGNVFVGSIRDDLGVRLIDALVVVGSGAASAPLGTVEPGRSAHFRLVVSNNVPPGESDLMPPGTVGSDPAGQGTAGSGQTGPGQQRSVRDKPAHTRQQGQQGQQGQRAQRAQRSQRSSSKEAVATAARVARTAGLEVEKALRSLTGTGRRAIPGTAASRATAKAARTARGELKTALGELAVSYSTEEGGAPVFVAMAAHKLFPYDAGALGASPATKNPLVTDVVVVPLSATPATIRAATIGAATATALTGHKSTGHTSPGHTSPGHTSPGHTSPGHASPGQTVADLPGELVGSAGVTGETASGVTTGSLTLRAGGSFDYQFLLPKARWRRLQLNLGSASGETAGSPLVALKAYNYATGHWDTLPVTSTYGYLLAQVPAVAHHLGPGGTLEVRVVAEVNGVEVYGGFPTLSASSAGGHSVLLP